MAQNLKVGEWVTLPTALPEVNGGVIYPADMMLVTSMDVMSKRKQIACVTILRTGERTAIAVRHLRRVKCSTS